MSKLIIHAIIPARGGSKGIPYKNICNYNGIPLIAYSIKSAQNCSLISHFIVSTDDNKIASIAKQYGANVPFIRPVEISDDLSRDYDFFIHYINYLKIENQPIPDIIVQLRPTTPDRTADELINIINAFINPSIYNNYDSLRTVVAVKKSPYKMYQISNECDTLLIPLFETYNNINEPYNAPRQILPQCYLHDGCVDIVKTSTLLDKHSVSGNKIYPYIRNITEDTIQDIDNPSDMKQLKL